jgi:hypothetical protein
MQEVVEPWALEEDVREALRLLDEPGSAIRYAGEAEDFVLRVVHYLNTRRLLLAELDCMERRLRGLLGYPVDTPIHLGPAVFPSAQALPWYEMVLGRRIGESGHLTGSSSGIRAQCAS